MKSSQKIVNFIKTKWQLITILLLLVVLVVQLLQLISAAPGSAAAAAGQITDWGLSFQGGSGDPPIANVSAEELAEYSAYYIGDTEKKYIYLTFDAGYENGHAPTVLDILKEKQVSATFFLVGDYFKSQPDLVKRMVEEGHTVANHTATHPDMSSIGSMEAFRAELEEVERLYYNIIGSEMPKLYRPPQGKFNVSNLQQAQLLGYKTVFWSLAYQDWDNAAQPDPQASIDKLNGRIHNGAIVLLHLNSETNAQILGQLIDSWRDMGYEFRPLTELVGLAVE